MRILFLKFLRNTEWIIYWLKYFEKTLEKYLDIVVVFHVPDDRAKGWIEAFKSSSR